MTAFSHSREAYRRTAYLRWIIAVLVVLIYLPGIYITLEESRTYRDLIGITPFYRVQIADQVLVPDGILVSGSMIKRRCEFDGLSAYVTTAAGRFRAQVNTRPEDRLRPTGNRPPSPDAQLWGPWLISADVMLHEITAWEIYARHICPENNGVSDNLFARGPWADVAAGPQP